MIRLSINAPLDKPNILKIPVVHRTVLSCNTKYMCRIVVPTSLRRIIFNLMYTTPVAGHIWEYKTLYWIRLQFCWPRLRSDISDWINHSLQYMLTYRWRWRGKESMFSWPVNSLFTILHVDLWMSDHHTYSNSYLSLMNVMCDMSQLIVVVPILDESSTTLYHLIAFNMF